MDRASNPFMPGAGQPPKVLAGREEDLEVLAAAFHRVKAKLAPRSIVFHGLRGVGKTVLLVQAQRIAASERPILLSAEAGKRNKSLFEDLLPSLAREVRRANLGKRAGHAFTGLATFLQSAASVFKVKIAGIDIGVDPPDADKRDAVGDIETDFEDALMLLAEAAEAADTTVALTVDELHLCDEASLNALVTTIHRANQLQRPLLLIGAGLPPVLEALATAKSYSERLFDLRRVDALNADEAAHALTEPLRQEGVTIETAVIDRVFEKTAGYPYFLQVWGEALWNAAETSPITLATLAKAEPVALKSLDEGFFATRLAKRTKKQKRYLRAMAELPGEEKKTAEIARLLEIDITRTSSTRQTLIDHGLIYSPEDKRVAYTVPLFGLFLKRTLPLEPWDAPED
ncbi:MAG: ATP-binding protein [Pseudomonadota bacterium]